MKVGSQQWEHLGTYTADSETELQTLRTILERHENPFTALGELPPGLSMT